MSVDLDVDQDIGRWLIEARSEMDRAEALWLERLAEFDRKGLWALDGQLSCAAWLVWRTGMGRSTAFDKLRVAHELERRPVVAEALREGRLSYSAARAITRMERPDPEVDQALVALAESTGASIVDIERVVRSYNLYADQERPPLEDPERSRDTKIIRGYQGTGQVVITLGDLETEEFAAALQAFLDLSRRSQPVDESSAEDSRDSQDSRDSREPWDEPVDESSREENWPARRADAFMDLVRTALAHAGGGHAPADDRYLVHLVTRQGAGVVTTLEGRPLHPADTAAVACDTSTVAHVVGDGGEPLYLGRKTREWTTAQRRAISVRDGGHCRFVGCDHCYYDIHHIRPWEEGGATDVANGCCMCRRHHRMLHGGYRVEGAPSELHFYRPDGTYLGSTCSAGTRWPAGD